MYPKRDFIIALLASAVAFSLTTITSGKACVWKVTAPNGRVLYLGGSIHALRSTDYPLPAAYNRAFDSASQIVFEEDPNVSKRALQSLSKSAEYPKGDSLKNHLDPRTYDYLRRLFARMQLPEEKFSRFKPWAVLELLWTPQLYGLSPGLGVEGYITRRARANNKPMSGLESFREHYDVLTGMSDHQAELVLLFSLIPDDEGGTGNRVLTAWHKGDADAIAAIDAAHYRDFASFQRRLIDDRNRNWLPKLETFLQSNRVYFVIAGAGHMGGPNGLIALLRGRGYQIEQL